jgi:hypothetical protein
MSGDKYKIDVIVNSNLPDYRLFIDFIWGSGHNVDSEGDSYNPASRNWTELYMSSRVKKGESFTIEQNKDNSLIYLISSYNEYVAKRAAYLLAKETSQKICVDEVEYKLDFLEDKLGQDFNLLDALKRADASIWRKSSLENPYSNLL